MNLKNILKLTLLVVGLIYPNFTLFNPNNLLTSMKELKFYSDRVTKVSSPKNMLKLNPDCNWAHFNLV